MSDTPISETEFERIERFLLGKLTESDAQSFLAELEKNSELVAKTETVKIQMEAVKDVSRKEFLDEVHSSLDSNKVKPLDSPFSKLKSLSIAASVAVLVGIGAIHVLSQNQSNDLYAQHFKADEGLITPMGSNDNYEFFRGMVDYKQGNYEEAIARWKGQLVLKKDNDSLNYYIGVSLMAQDHTEAAIPFLKQAEENQGGAFYQDVLYYRALAELNEGRESIAKEYLNRCSSPKAKKLLDLLNQK
ncbi:MAG: tol-pal system YbgF family protein [Flavobacteriales bacterium]